MYQRIVFSTIIIFLISCQHETAEPPRHIDRPKQKIEVDTVSVFEGLTTRKYSGLVEAKDATTLSFKNPGTVIEVLVDEGEYVKKGQLLAKLNDSNAQNTYQLAFMQQQQAQDAYDRMKPMYENGTLPEIQWVEVVTGLSQAKTSTEMAKRSIEDTKLHAPKSGLIGSKSIQLGVNVLPSSEAFQLVDINTVHINIPVPENEVSSLKVGQYATIEIAAINKTLEGKIHQIGVSADPVSHTYSTLIAVKNKDWKIKPGMVCQVQIAGQSVSGIAISNSALLRDALGDQFVYVLKDSMVVTRAVQTIDFIENRVLVTNLSDEEVVVTSGQHKLSEGSLVQIVKHLN